jgi:hypothetical protein
LTPFFDWNDKQKILKTFFTFNLDFYHYPTITS